MSTPRICVLAAGTRIDGGGGFRNLVKASRRGTLYGEIVSVISCYEHGGVRKHAKELGIPFHYFKGPFTEPMYQHFVNRVPADVYALSGWVKPVVGLDPKVTFNIHPGPLPGYGGKGMYGIRIHRKVMEAYRRGEIKETQICMHFIDESKEYDTGPVFFRLRISINDDDTPETLQRRVNQLEHVWQPQITSLVANRHITWDGENPASLVVPEGYSITRRDDSVLS